MAHLLERWHKPSSEILADKLVQVKMQSKRESCEKREHIKGKEGGIIGGK